MTPCSRPPPRILVISPAGRTCLAFSSLFACIAFSIACFDIVRSARIASWTLSIVVYCQRCCCRVHDRFSLRSHLRLHFRFCFRFHCRFRRRFRCRFRCRCICGRRWRRRRRRRTSYTWRRRHPANSNFHGADCCLERLRRSVAFMTGGIARERCDSQERWDGGRGGAALSRPASNRVRHHFSGLTRGDHTLADTRQRRHIITPIPLRKPTSDPGPDPNPVTCRGASRSPRRGCRGRLGAAAAAAAPSQRRSHHPLKQSPR